MKTQIRWLFAAVAATAAYAAPASAAPAQDRDYYDTPRNCRDVEVTRQKEPKDRHRIAGTAIGAVAGGVIGHQFGKGKGKTAATAAGAIGGGVVGNKVQKSTQRNDTETVVERRCD
ncbi:MAG TPA: glycine zipper 2TM domain-containing protein [Dokdonella sp.]